LEQARQSYSKAVQLDPKLSTSLLKKGHIDSFLGKYNDARGDYDKALSAAVGINKMNYAVFRGLVDVYAGNPDAAIQELTTLASTKTLDGATNDQIEGARIGVLTTALTIALHHKMIEQSTQLLQQLRAATTANNKLVNNADFSRQADAGLLLFDSQLAALKGDYQTATAKAEANKKLVETDTNPRKLEGYYGALGFIDLQKKSFATAVENYKKADLTIPFNKYFLALSLDGAGNHEEAKKLYQEIGRFNFNTVGFALVRAEVLKRST
jgi:tetratricopeptide (TPR) repeat protein